LVVGKFAVVHQFNFAAFEQNGFDDFIHGVIHHVGAAGLFDYFQATVFGDNGGNVVVLFHQEQFAATVVGQSPDFFDSGDDFLLARGLVKGFQGIVVALLSY
jgi:hypothetical protein